MIPSYTKQDVKLACEQALPVLKLRSELASRANDAIRAQNSKAWEAKRANPASRLSPMMYDGWPEPFSGESAADRVQSLLARLDEGEVNILMPDEYEAIKDYLPAARVTEG